MENKKEYKFEIYEIHEDNELIVVSGSGKNKEELETELQHYAYQYAQDGEIKIKRNYKY